jgi:hypothetical protein
MLRNSPLHGLCLVQTHSIFVWAEGSCASFVIGDLVSASSLSLCVGIVAPYLCRVLDCERFSKLLYAPAGGQEAADAASAGVGPAHVGALWRAQCGEVLACAGEFTPRCMRADASMLALRAERATTSVLAAANVPHCMPVSPSVVNVSSSSILTLGAVIWNARGVQLPLHNPFDQDGPFLLKHQQAPGSSAGLKRQGDLTSSRCAAAHQQYHVSADFVYL